MDSSCGPVQTFDHILLSCRSNGYSRWSKPSDQPGEKCDIGVSLGIPTLCAKYLCKRQQIEAGTGLGRFHEQEKKAGGACPSFEVVSRLHYLLI